MQRLFLLLLTAVILFSGCSQEKETEEEKFIPVHIYKTKQENISKIIKLTGAISAEQDVIVYSKMSERLERVLVKAGDRVSANQVLAVQYNALLKQGVEAAEAAVKNAEAQSSLTNIEYERVERLYKQNAVSKQQFDQASAQRKSASSALEQANAMLNQAKEQYENSFIKAPFNGVAASVNFEENQMVPAGMPVVQIVGTNGMKAKLHVTGTEIHLIKPGQKVRVNFPAVPNSEYKGIVTILNQAVDQISKTLEVEVNVTNPDARLKSGMFGEFLIETESIENSVVVPELALIPQTEIKIDRETGLQRTIKKFYLYVIENKKAIMKEVTTGIANNGQIEITNGLNVGDSVIVVGQNIVKEGQTVNVIE